MFVIPLVFFLTIHLAAGNIMYETITIESLNILKSPYVYMKNESAVFEKINKIISEGAEKLQLVTDFDETITKQHENNKTSIDAFEIFYKCKQLPRANMDRINERRLKMYATTLNATIPIEQRKQFADDSYQAGFDNLKGFQFDRQEIEEVVREYGSSFRDRTDELFLKLKNLKIPVTLVSGGLIDVIKVQFNQKNIEWDNINFIMNQLKFNGTILDGFQNPKYVHTFNKHEHLNANSDVFKVRKNVILMGDHTGDATMIGGYDPELTILKIGFFYHQSEENLKIYKDMFDIVLDNDQTMNVILDIINLL